MFFIDLVAAYDSVVREPAFGFPHSYAGNKIDYLLSVGLERDIAMWLVKYIEIEKPIFERIGVPRKICRMINAIHTMSWARYGNLTLVIVSSKGGRQGCKLGGIIFNAIFTLAMEEVRGKLSSGGIIFEAKFLKDAPF